MLTVDVGIVCSNRSCILACVFIFNNPKSTVVLGKHSPVRMKEPVFGGTFAADQYTFASPVRAAREGRVL